jgi:hypothetical protein
MGLVTSFGVLALRLLGTGKTGRVQELRGSTPAGTPLQAAEGWIIAPRGAFSYSRHAI